MMRMPNGDDGSAYSIRRLAALPLALSGKPTCDATDLYER